MHIKLPTTAEEFVHDEVASGRYESAVEVIDSGKTLPPTIWRLPIVGSTSWRA